MESTAIANSRYGQRVNGPRRGKETGLIGELFGCLFPSSAFVRNLENDFEQLAHGELLTTEGVTKSLAANSNECTTADSFTQSESDNTTETTGSIL